MTGEPQLPTLPYYHPPYHPLKTREGGTWSSLRLIRDMVRERLGFGGKEIGVSVSFQGSMVSVLYMDARSASVHSRDGLTERSH